MTEFNPVTLIDKVSNIYDDVVTSRLACKTAFARELHDNLLGKLEEMMEDLRREVDTWNVLHAERHKTKDDALLFEIYYIRTIFEERWIGNGNWKISILDDIYAVLTDDDGEECLVIDVEHTFVPAAELESLPALFDRIEQVTGVVFVAARV